MPPNIFKAVLTTGVILIWGLIIYRIFNVSNDNVPKNIFPVEAHQLTEQPNDSFYLYANYPDPFIPDQDSVILGDSVKSNSVLPIIKSEIIKPDISFIQYHGMINNLSKKRIIGLLEIKGKDVLIKKQQKLGDITVIKIKKDDLSIIYKGQFFVIPKSQ